MPIGGINVVQTTAYPSAVAALAHRLLFTEVIIMDGSSEFESIPQRYPELRGQVALITGSARGIGKGIALRLGREGMRLVITSRTAEEVRATAAGLRASGVEVLEFVGDIGQARVVDELFEATINEFGTVDVLVNNAGGMGSPPFPELDEARFDATMATNVKGPFLCSSRAVEIMRKGTGGSIIHISSVGGLRAHERGVPYDMTKAALDGLTRAMGIELADYGIRVNAIAPGAIHTERRPPLDDPEVRAQAYRIPMRRLGRTLEIGSVVAFLASSDASYITGQVLYVDGGITAQLYPRGQTI
jgi:NAD(P)-dependent dehydrogenase (short-subunit alcohol dehydrogenase family)